MELIIENKSNIDLNSFCKYLIDYIQQNITTFIDETKLIRYDLYLNNQTKYKRIEKVFKCKSLIIASTYNLIIQKIKNNYIIKIDNNTYIPDMNLKYIDLIKLINYGNLNLPSYPIYDNIMNYLADNINLFYNYYLDEVN